MRISVQVMYPWVLMGEEGWRKWERMRFGLGWGTEWGCDIHCMLTSVGSHGELWSVNCHPMQGDCPFSPQATWSLTIISLWGGSHLAEDSFLGKETAVIPTVNTPGSRGWEYQLVNRTWMDINSFNLHGNLHLIQKVNGAQRSYAIWLVWQIIFLKLHCIILSFLDENVLSGMGYYIYSFK